MRLILLLAVLLTGYPALSLADSLEDMRARGMQCVEPVDVMRRQHMDFLLHQRDLTMRQGIRTEQHSLVECIECHVQTNNRDEFIAIDAPQQFCAGCHAFASVSMDCFECHASTPDLPQAASGLIREALTVRLARELAQHLAQPAGGTE